MGVFTHPSAFHPRPHVAQEVRALADVHEKELEQAMAADDTAVNPKGRQGGGMASTGTAVGGGGAGTGGGGGGSSSAGNSNADDAGHENGDTPSGGGVGGAVGLEFWSRQSDLWSGVFTEQQTGLLQMVRAQEAELRQGKRRISSLESELSALNDKRAELEKSATANAARATGTAGEAAAAARGSRSVSGSIRDHRPGPSLSEAEASDWRQRLERMQADYERRLSAVQEREAAVAAVELRVESRARELGSERDRLTAGAVALSAEADGLR